MTSFTVGADHLMHMKYEVSPILQALNEARVKYAVWGAAAAVHHGGRWLWKCLDYEIFIEDWFDGPLMQRAVNTITSRCSAMWEYDARFDDIAWSTARGDRPPRRPVRRFRHKHKLHDSGTGIEFGIILVPSVSSYIASMHHDDLVNEEAEPIWIYPSLKNFVESQLKQWSLDGRNSSLLELADVMGARKLNDAWAVDVGLDLGMTRRPGRLDLPSEWEMWQELVRMALCSGNPDVATARLRARRAAKEALAREQQEQQQQQHIQQLEEMQIEGDGQAQEV